MSIQGMFNGSGSLDDNIRMIKNTGAKFIGRSFAQWGRELRLLESLETLNSKAARVHAVDPDVVLEACIFEIITQEVDQMPVPAWALTALNMPVEQRHFRYTDMLYPPDPKRVRQDGRFNHDMWWKGASVPDMSQPETKLWFLFIAAQYIDAGIESIHFGQVEIMNGNDPDLTHWSHMLELVRTYAAKHARRGMVLCNAHVPTGGQVRHGQLLFDFHCFPIRPKETPDKPQEAILEMGYNDSLYGRSKGGRTFSGWSCEHLPYIVEYDM